MKNKIVCLALAFCMIFLCSSCKGAENTGSGEMPSQEISDSTSKKEITLLYSYNDTFNPYTATTEANLKLSTLIYDSLVKTDNRFEPHLSLAKDYTRQDNAYTVTIKDAVFTDGSAVTADDVIYSYNIAKTHPLYMYNFYEVVSVEKQDGKTVKFNLSQNDDYFINLLDFPIVKSQTSGLTTTDGKEIPPIGSGRYKLNQDNTGLEINNSYHGTIGKIAIINLINSPDSSSTSHYVEIGATNLYYNGGDDIVRMSAKKTEVNLNRLIYIGINSSYGPLQSKEMRYAISSALDRTEICRSAYYNNATPAKGFFNPDFAVTKPLQTISETANNKITVENLEKIGYNNMNSNGYYANSSGSNPSFTLLVNSENSSRVAAANLIAEQLKAEGIQITVVQCSYEQYTARLASNDFQLYLGEVQILDNMDFSQLVIPGGTAAFGVGNAVGNQGETGTEEGLQNEQAHAVAKTPCEAIIESYRGGQCSISDVAGVLLTEMPQIPVCYKNGVFFYDSQISGAVESSSSDIYFSIENYEF